MSTDSESTSDQLRSFLSRKPLRLLPKELTEVLSTFVVQDANLRSLAYALLASLLLHDPKLNTNELKTPLENWLNGTDIVDHTKALAALSATFQIDCKRSLEICRDKHFESLLTEAIQLIIVGPTTKSSAKLLEQMDKSRLELLNLLSAATVDKAAITIITKLGPEPWLSSLVKDLKASSLFRALSAVILIKLDWGGDRSLDVKPVVDNDLDQFLNLFDSILSKSTSIDDPAIAVTLEGLALISLTPSIKAKMSNKEALLKLLCQLLPRLSKPSHEVEYSLVTIFFNLSRYKPALTEEERTTERLRRMAAKGDQADDPEEASDRVNLRISNLLSANVMEPLNRLAKNPRESIRRLVGSTLLQLVERTDRRGKVLQSGGAKSISIIIRSQSADINPQDLEAVQALAKLFITSNPLIILGPQIDSPALIDSIRPLGSLLLHASSSTLQQFESLMALTNLASLHETIRDRIASIPGLLAKVEDTMIESRGNGLPRRAATELICNLVTCHAGFERFQNDSRLHLLLALCDVEDAATRRAASGALATLTIAPDACASLIKRQSILDIFSRSLQDDDEGQRHRSVICVGNICMAKVDGGKVTKVWYPLLIELSKSDKDHSVREAGLAVVNALQIG